MTTGPYPELSCPVQTMTTEVALKPSSAAAHAPAVSCCLPRGAHVLFLWRLCSGTYERGRKSTDRLRARGQAQLAKGLQQQLVVRKLFAEAVVATLADKYATHNRQGEGASPAQRDPFAGAPRKQKLKIAPPKGSRKPSPLVNGEIVFARRLRGSPLAEAIPKDFSRNKRLRSRMTDSYCTFKTSGPASTSGV